MSDDDNSHFDSLGGLVRLSGVNLPSRARFIAETVFSASLGSVTFGLVCGQLGAITPVGPLLPFLTGSLVGYSVGLVAHWTTSQRLMWTYAEKYPHMLRHGMEQEFMNFRPPIMENIPPVTTTEEGENASLRAWIEQGGIGRISWSILASHNCRGTIDELMQSQQQSLMEQTLSGYNACEES